MNLWIVKLAVKATAHLAKRRALGMVARRLGRGRTAAAAGVAHVLARLARRKGRRK